MSRRSWLRTATTKQRYASILALVAVAAGVSYGAAHVFRSQTHDYLHAVITPDGMDARSTAIFLTDTSHWTATQADHAQRLSQMHTLVLGIDAAGLLADLDGDCDLLGPALADLAKQVQTEEAALPRTPVLVSFDDAFPYAMAAAQHGVTLFKGLVTTNAVSQTAACSVATDEQAIASNAKSPLRWFDLTSDPESSPTQDFAGADAVTFTPDAQRAFNKSYLRLAGTDSSFDLGTVPQSADLADLPLTVHASEASAPSDTYAIFLSGDGGWAKFDEEVSDRMAERGIPVVGISSLRYMWQEKQPAQIAADIQRIDAHYREIFNAKRLLLVGFSLGANTLPFATSALPVDLRGDLAGVVLLAPETLTGFEIVVGGWLGQATGSVEVAPQIDQLATEINPGQILCIYGKKEKVSACPEVQTQGIPRHAFEGGHHLSKDYDGVTDLIVTLSEDTQS